MPNVRTISPEDIEKYDLKGKQVGDTITAEEDYEMRKKAGENVEPIDPATGLTGLPSSVETVMDDDSEAAESRATRRASKTENKSESKK